MGFDMRVLSFSQNFSFNLSGNERVDITANRKYVFTESFVREFKTIYGASSITYDVPLQNAVEVSKVYNKQELTDETIFIFRTGGIGDLMAMMVGARLLKRKYPYCKIVVGSMGIYRDLLEDDPDVLEFIPIPYPFDYIKNSHYYMGFQGIIQNNHESRYLNLYDLFIKEFGVEDINPDEKIPKIFVNDEVDYDISITIEGKGIKRPIAGIQLETSTVIRDYIPEYIKGLIAMLNSHGINVILIGEPKATNSLIKPYLLCDEEKSFDFAQHCLTLNHLISIINNCDFLIGPDTSGLHIAGALGKPMVGIFGVIPSNLRISYFKKAVGIDCKTRCSPCFLHQNRPCRYSIDNRGYSPCMHLATPDKVFNVIIENILPLFGITKQASPPEPKKETVDEKKALVTLAIGKQAQDMLEIARPSFKLYADKIKADFVVIDEEKINAGYPNLEKFQIGELLDKYDRILYLDVDIIIHPGCPDLFSIVSKEALGVVPDCSDGKWGNINRFKEIVAAQNILGGVGWSSGYFNSGVMVLSRIHKDIFTNPENREKISSQFRDQTLINYNFQKLWQQDQSIDIFILDKKFNGMEINGFSTRFENPNKTEAFIMHFAHEGEDRIGAMREVANMFKEFRTNMSNSKLYPDNRPLLLYDVGELGWSMYISAHINYLLFEDELEDITICTKRAKFPLYDERVKKLEIPESIQEQIKELTPEGHHMFNVADNIRIKHDVLGPMFEKVFKTYNVVTTYGYFHGMRIFNKYKPSNAGEITASNILAHKKGILIFPRCRPGKFGSRNLSKEFYIELCNKLCYIYRNHVVISIGSQSGAYMLDDFVKYDNFIDLTLWNDDETLDIFIAICNAGRIELAFGSQSALPKMSLLHDVPTYMIGHEKERHEKTENWMNTRTTFRKVRETENGYELNKDDWDKVIDEIIEFGGIDKPILLDEKDTSDIESKKIKDYFDESPLLFYDVGELGWTQHLVAYIKSFRRYNPWMRIMVVTSKAKFIFYRDCCDELQPLSTKTEELIAGYEGEAGWLLNPNNKSDKLNYIKLKKHFEQMYPQCDVFNEHAKLAMVKKFYYRPYISSRDARNIAKEITEDKYQLIVVFPRHRPGIYSTRNLPLDFYIKLINRLYSDFPNHKIVTIGSKLGAYDMVKYIDLEDRFEDLVNYDNEKTLDILVAFCNLRLADFTVGPQSGVSKISLLCGVPSFMIGHERDRHMINDNWADTLCDFIEVEKGANGYIMDGDMVEESLNHIVGFGKKAIGGVNEDRI
jgi:ADP-heptose:LPS heptosyltransferase/lipopolysaccharide biosynthesis glycosyltransferase